MRVTIDGISLHMYVYNIAYSCIELRNPIKHFTCRDFQYRRSVRRVLRHFITHMTFSRENNRAFLIDYLKVVAIR